MAQRNMCNFCGQRPKNSGFDYCGKRCGQDAQKAGPNSNLCEECHSKPKRVERDNQGHLVTHRYCGRTCADKAQKGRPSNGHRGSSKSCKLPGCRTPVTDASHDYCTNGHREQAVKDGHATACLLCRRYPQSGGCFCGRKCESNATNSAPMLLSVPRKDPKFNDISHQFGDSWRHTKPKPTIKYIYRIVQASAVWSQYTNYRDLIESRGNFKKRGMSAGNECRRWHGTTRLCDLGDDPKKATLCSDPSCPMCSIIKTSFQVKLCNSSGRSFNRFGKAIYASATSSKADDYAHNNQTSLSPNKAILLNKVVVGKGAVLHMDSPLMTDAPPGYDSVLAEPLAIPIPGMLNYDEVVVYKDAAIVPAYVVVY